MKLRLYITAKSVSKVTSYRQEHIFAVIDLDRAKNYPENFVCVLPKLTSNLKASSAFLLIFKEQSLPTAKSLLTKALRSEQEPAIKAEIQNRLNALKPKQPPKAKCSRCGNIFEPKSFGRYQQKMCQACKNKPVSQQLSH